MWRGWGWNEEDRVGCREKQRQKKELENDAHRTSGCPSPQACCTGLPGFKSHAALYLPVAHL